MTFADDLPLPPASLSSKASHSLFERALEALPDGVLVISSKRQIVYVNPAFAWHWRIPSASLAAWGETEMLRHASEQLLDPGSFLREVERLHPTDEASQDELRFKDGRILTRRSVPFLADQAFQARIWIFTDVTEARQSLIDTLSGVPNRRAYSRDYPRFVEAEDDGLLRSVAIMDIDNFKAYNDQYGHAAGDAVLQRVGALLQASLRDDDLVFRIGGEEFLLACKARNAKEAKHLFDKICRRLATLAIPHAGNPPHNVVTASIGFGVFRGPQKPAEIFEGVDTALYRAKSSGRNLVCDAAFT